MKRAAGSDVGRSSAKRLRLDDALCDALRTSTEAFIANDPESFDHLNIEQIDAAIKIAQQNKELRKLGLDGTGCPLSADTAAALGALPVRELKFVGLAFASEAARTAFADAIGRSEALTSLAIFETNADGEWSRFRPADSAFAAAIQSRRTAHSRQPLVIEQIDDAEEEEEAEDDGEEEDGGEESDEDEEDFVQCDGHTGARRERVACGKRLKGEDAVFTSAFGKDFCAECHERLYRDREPLRKLTAAERVLEDVVPEVT